MRTIKLVLILCLSAFAFGQQDGVTNFSAADYFDIDTVNLMTLTPTLNVHTPSKAEIIPWSFGLTQTQACSTSGTGSGSSISCGTPTANFKVFAPGLLGMYVQATQVTQNWCQGVSGLGWYNIYAGWQLVSGDGLDVHPLPAPAIYQCGGATSFNVVASDGSGYRVQLSLGGSLMNTWSVTYTSASGHTASISGSLSQTTLTETDPFGNTQKNTANGYVDSLGVVTLNSGIDGNGNIYWHWPDTNGVQQPLTFVFGASIPVSINTTPCNVNHFSPTSITPISEITYPDNTSVNITMEQGYSGAGTTTGRVGSFTTREGGTISYGYPAPCSSVALTGNPSLARTTPDGTYTYTQTLTSTTSSYTTVLDPGKNKRVYYFTFAAPSATVPLVPFLTQVQVYQNTGTVSSPVYTLLSRTLYCYNGNLSNCATTQASYPITEKDTFVNYGSMTVNSRVKETYDSYGNTISVSRYDFGSTGISPTTITTISYGSWNGSSCVAIGNGITNKPCRVTTTDNASHTISDATYSYLSNGFLSGENHWTGTQWITTMTASANGNGTVRQQYNSLGTPTSYSYANCNGMLPTGASVTVGTAVLTTGATWDCNMGKLLTSTDENSNSSQFTYDLLGRPASQQDPIGYLVSESYPTALTSTQGDSFATTTTTVGDLGRVNRVQTTDISGYDTTSFRYAFNGTQWQVSASQPCIAALNADCPLNHFNIVDPLGRTISTSTTNNETVSTVYYADSTHPVFDVQTTLSPAPSGERLKVVQTEYDGLGRVKSVCALQASGGASCGQAMGGSGVLTSYSYAYGPGGQTTVTATRDSQTHTLKYDAMGRLISSTTPEEGTTSYIYDQATASCSSGSAPGFLMEVVDNAGLHTCQGYDTIGRPTNTFVSGTSNPCHVTVFGDQSGLSVLNADNRIAEAWTDSDCSGTNKITDEQFSYDQDGRTTDVWESTPHSGGQYHTTAKYYINGQLNTLTGIPGYSTYTVSLDPNGRPNSSTLGTTQLANGVVRNGAGQPTTIGYGTGSFQDTYGYDANTGRMKSYSFAATQTVSGILTWNANGTLNQLAITDGFYPAGTQTCNFTYDDIARLLTDNCGTVWSQTYTYDQYDNLTKAGSTYWNPGYNSANNRITGASYDADGQLTYDLNNSYAWDGYHKMITANSGTSLGSCGNSGVSCVTYDAFGRPVESNNGGVYSQILYSPVGRVAIMSGLTTVTNAELPLPGGQSMWLNGAGGSNFKLVNHTDWLGSVRLQTGLISGNAQFDAAYTPYGELYNVRTGSSTRQNFTGDHQDLFAGLFDTPNRELDQASGSRWLSPDPAHASWNAYAYPTNPNSSIDPSGLYGEEPSTCGGGEKPCTPQDNGNQNPGILNFCTFTPGPEGGVACGNSGSVKLVPGQSIPGNDMSGIGTIMLSGGFWGEGGVQGSDAALGLVGRIASNSILSSLGRTSWSNWWQETGCQAGKVCMGVVSPRGKFSDEFFDVMNTRANFTPAERPNRLPDRISTAPSDAPWLKFNRNKTYTTTGEPIYSFYWDAPELGGMFRQSNHWGQLGINNWSLDGVVSPNEFKMFYGEWPTGFIRYEDMGPMLR